MNRILLHDMHGMTCPEIAEAIGVSLANVKVRLHRARVKLRAALQAACEIQRYEGGAVDCEPRQ